MHSHSAASLAPWRHDHRFGLHRRRSAERRTKLVVAITLAMMAAEIVGGLAFGSMALLADGLHMGSHALALGISAFAYVWMRRRAGDSRFSFGTGKMSALGGFAGALLLVVPASLMAWESVAKLFAPTPIDFGPALALAVAGLLVNAVCAVILAHGDHRHEHDHAPARSHDHDHDHAGHADHNLRAAFLHVAADALTSLLAIAALLGGRYLGLAWLDPAMGLVGAAVVMVWAAGLLRGSAQVLLDREAPPAIRRAVERAIESDEDNRLVDLHIWSIGPGIYAGALALVTHRPKPPDAYKALVPASLGIRHLTVEVHTCPDAEPETVSAAG